MIPAAPKSSSTLEVRSRLRLGEQAYDGFNKDLENFEKEKFINGY